MLVFRIFNANGEPGGFFLEHEEARAAEYVKVYGGKYVLTDLTTKIWTIDEFIAECVELMKNQYTYDYSRMPDGICNGHKVGANRNFWHSINIDDHWDSLTVIDEKHPTGNALFGDGTGAAHNVIEHLRYVLSK